MLVKMTYLDNVADRIRACLPSGSAQPHEEGLFAIYAVLLRAKGVDVTSSDVHDAWCAWMQNRGQHDVSMVPFRELPESVQHKDDLFAAAIRAAAEGPSSAGS
jgi:hypothetical protein